MLACAVRSTDPAGSGESLPAIGLGTSDEFESAGENIEQLREVLRLFIDLGGRLIDTAPGYGDAEQVLGDLMNDLRNY